MKTDNDANVACIVIRGRGADHALQRSATMLRCGVGSIFRAVPACTHD